VVCSANLLLVICILHAALSPLQMKSSHVNLVMLPKGGVQAGVSYVTKKELERRVESNRQRRALLPLQLIQRVKEIEAETEMEIDNSRKSNQARQKVADELAKRLREIKRSHSQSNQQGLEAWRKKRLQGVITKQVKQIEETKPSEEESTTLDPALQLQVDEIASDDGISMEQLDMEHEVIPGRQLPPECHAEAHTEYSGLAVRWGLTFHVASAADCCQACLDQAKNSLANEKKCNVWVYCPEAGGCFSPDKYKHREQECWLKQADDPEINYKGHYDEEFRQQFPTAPVIVSWVSGVIS